MREGAIEETVIPENPLDVLYLALEDNWQRLQRRLTKLLPTFTGEWPSGLTLATGWRRVNEGGLDDIRAEVRQSVERLLAVRGFNSLVTPGLKGCCQELPVERSILDDQNGGHALQMLPRKHALRAGRRNSPRAIVSRTTRDVETPERG